MADYSFLSKSDRLKQLQADFQQSISTADRSHLEPLPFVPSSVDSSNIDYRAVDRAQIRLSKHLSDLEKRGLYRVFDALLNCFFLTANPNHPNLSSSDAVTVQQSQDAETNLRFRAAGLAKDGSAEFKFIEKNRQSLPVTRTKNAINLDFLALDGISSETVEMFGFCNTQTIAAIEAKLTINRSDFLSR